jgi:hypothetical protein
MPVSPPKAVGRGRGGGMVRRPLAPPEAGGYMGPRGGGRPIYPLDETSGYHGEKRPRVGQQAEEAQGGPGQEGSEGGRVVQAVPRPVDQKGHIEMAFEAACHEIAGAGLEGASLFL